MNYCLLIVFLTHFWYLIQ